MELHYTPLNTPVVESLTVLRSLPTEALRLPFPEGRRWVPYRSIVACQSEGNYTRLFFRNGTSLLYSRTLGHVLTLLPQASFARIHRSHAVNRYYIEIIKANSIRLKDGTE